MKTANTVKISSQTYCQVVHVSVERKLRLYLSNVDGSSEVKALRRLVLALGLLSGGRAGMGWKQNWVMV